MNPAPTNDPYYRPRAVIFIPDTGAIEAAARCMAFVRRHRYHLVGTVTGSWEKAQEAIRDTGAQVLVIDQRGHMPADAEPRLEVVAEQDRPMAGRNQSRIHRRTRVIRPGGAE